MRKVILFFIFLLFLASQGFATHQRAAEITYKHLQGLTYEFTITMYTRTSSPADDTRTYMPINWGDGTGDEIKRIVFEPVPGVFDITYNLYKGQHTFPAPGTYKISVEDPNRNNGVINIPNSVNVPMYVETELVINPFLGFNNSVQLLNPPIDQGCVGKIFVYNPAAYDVDGDSLSYKLVVCKGAGGMDIPGYTFPKTQPGGTFKIDSITGEVYWEVPVLQGEYNIAFVITEWRFGIKVGSVRRDMQINIVACDHDPPNLYGIDDTCVIAGDFLQFDITAIDPDETNVQLTAFGGPFEQSVNPAYIEPDPAMGNDTVTTTFNWPTTCAHVRFKPYTAIFKARDSGFPVSLVNFKTVFISVIAPPPENLEAQSLGNGINLQWNKSICKNVTGYKIYRRSGPSGWEPGYCETGVPFYTGFRLIKTLDGIEDTTFRDDNQGIGLVHGINYCYRVTAFFNDEAESRASNEACAYLKRDVPIITTVSNDSLNLQSGNVLVAWSKPTELDTIQYPGPYKYVIQRNNGLNWDSPQKITELSGLDDTTYKDKTVNLNTNQNPYVYQIDLESQTIGYIGSSQKASSIYVRTEPTDEEIKLLWLPVVPWQNEYYTIYRKGPGETVFDSIGSSLFGAYRDQGLDNGQRYCYYVKSVGHYSLPGLLDPLINYSQIVCDKPLDNIPPCKPVLGVETDCEEISNTLIWSLPYDSCSQDVASYQIYFTAQKGGDMALIKTIDNPYDTSWIDNEIQNVVGCYSVTATDSVGNVSEMSDTVCVDYDTCPPYCLPNVFTPNNDGKNDLFVPRGCLEGGPINPYVNVERVDMKIFNRWGQLMFTTDDPMINWDGKNQTNNQDCPAGVYYYTCEVYIITINGLDQMTLKGSVTLFR